MNRPVESSLILRKPSTPLSKSGLSVEHRKDEAMLRIGPIARHNMQTKMNQRTPSRSGECNRQRSKPDNTVHQLKVPHVPRAAKPTKKAQYMAGLARNADRTRSPMPPEIPTTRTPQPSRMRVSPAPTSDQPRSWA